MKFKTIFLNILLLFLVGSGGYLLGNKGIDSAFTPKVNEKPQQDNISSDEQKAKKAILSYLKKLDASVEDVEIEASPVAGIYWVLLPDNSTALISADGRYYLGNDLAEIGDKKLNRVSSQIATNATSKIRQLASQTFQETNDSQIIYAAQGEKKASVYVFTDVNCGYCRKFHKDVPTLTKAGIEVHYLAGPFFSRDRASLEKVWCSSDQKKALTMAKSGAKLDQVTVTDECKDIVSKDIALGQKLGIRGTPAIFTKDGIQLGGYLPPQQLIARLTENSGQ